MLSRQSCSNVFIFLLLFSLILPLGGGFLQAQSAGVGTENLSVILVIDISGSMRTTDPERLRETAAQVFIDLLSPDDYLGVVLFDDQAEVAIPLQQVQGSARKDRFKEILSPRLDPRGATDFHAALQAAFAQLETADSGAGRPLVVLLTDGKPNPVPARQEDQDFMGRYLEDVWELARQFDQAGYPIYTVAFSDDIDPDFIRQISTETQGHDYILKDASELLVTFFDVLGGLKKRSGFLQESFSGGAETYSFEVTGLVSQVNLVAVNLGGGDVDLTLIPPAGAVVGGEELSMHTGNHYSLATLYGNIPTGLWQVSVSGEGPIEVMGDMDYHIKASFREPLPGVQHPLDEPLSFRVFVERQEGVLQGLAGVEVLVTKPGEDAPVTVLLAEEGDYFVGRYEDVDRAGIYELEALLLLEGEAFSADTHAVSVRRLPTLVTDFWGGEGFRLGEELLVTASMNLAGRRMKEGRELEVDDFYFLFRYEDGEEVRMPLYDSGLPEHGNFRAGDGFWSNYIVFEKTGAGQAYLLGNGDYMGSPFSMRKSVNSFQVEAPGSVLLSFRERAFLAAPGQTLSIPLSVRNESFFVENVTVEAPEGLGMFTPSSISLEPGQYRELDLKLVLGEEVEKGEYPLAVSFQADHPLTLLDPAAFQFSLNVVSAAEVFLRTHLYSIMTGTVFLVVFVLVLLMFYVLGLLFYGLIVLPQSMIGGKLSVMRDEKSKPEENQPRQLKLWKLKKNPIIITFDPERREKADYFIEGSDYSYDLIIKADWDIRYPRFIQGWKAFLKRDIPLRIFVRSTPPGIMEHNGEIFTEKTLSYSDSFQSGGFVFQYDNPSGKRRRRKEKGMNILERRMEGS